MDIILNKLVNGAIEIWKNEKYLKTPNRYVAVFRGNIFMIYDDHKPIYYLCKPTESFVNVYVVDHIYCEYSDYICYIKDTGAVRPIKCPAKQDFLPKGDILDKLSNLLSENFSDN